ncbi:hypothetical protein DFS34DRAFT_625583 [Phlyctochytrium arcticum]|nr:hypothetical protein DFS34DRAFT_625583 [Phlyctochytrium arcticum]
MSLETAKNGLLAVHSKHVANPENELLRTQFYHEACKYFLEESSPDEHVLCANAEIATDLLGLFSLDNVAGTQVGDIQSLINDYLSACLTCVDTYHDAKARFKRRYEALYGEELMDGFLTRLWNWDAKRQIDAAQSFVSRLEASRDGANREWKATRKGATILMYEILTYPETLKDLSLDLLFIHLFHEIHGTSKSSALELRGESVMPGSLILAIHEDNKVRKWARKAIDASPARISPEQLLPITSISKILSDVLALLSGNLLKEDSYRYTHDQSELWKGISVILSAMDAVAIGEPLLQLEKASAVSLNALVVRQIMQSPENIWDYLAPFIPLANHRSDVLTVATMEEGSLGFCKAILNNSTFRSCMENDIDVQSHPMCCKWIVPFLSRSGNASAAQEILTNSRTWCPTARGALDILLLGALRKQDIEAFKFSPTLSCKVALHLMERFDATSDTAPDVLSNVLPILQKDGDILSQINLACKLLEYFSQVQIELMTIGALDLNAWFESFALPACLLAAGIRWAKLVSGASVAISDMIMKTMRTIELCLDIFDNQMRTEDVQTQQFMVTFGNLAKWMISLHPDISRKSFRLLYEMLRVSWRVGIKVDKIVLDRLTRLANGSIKSQLSTLKKTLMLTWISQNEDVAEGADIPMRPSESLFSESQGSVIDLSEAEYIAPTIKPAVGNHLPKPQVIDLSADEVSPSKYPSATIVKEEKPSSYTTHDETSFRPTPKMSSSDANLRAGYSTGPGGSKITSTNRSVQKSKESERGAMKKFLDTTPTKSVWEELAADALKFPEKRPEPKSAAFSLSRPSKLVPKIPKTDKPVGSKMQQLRMQMAEELRLKDKNPARPFVPSVPGGPARSALPEVTIKPHELESEASSFSAFEKPKGVQLLDAPTTGLGGPRRAGIPIQVPRANATSKPLRDISDLYNYVLSWTIDMDGDMPIPSKLKCQSIPSDFHSPEQYAAVFEPLLLLECWEQLQKGKEELSDQQPLRAALENVQMVDNFHDLTIKLGAQDVRLSGFSEHDVLNIEQASSRPSDKPKASFLGKVQSVSFRGDVAIMTLRAHIAARPKLMPFILLGSNWTLTRVFSLTTNYREYHSIISLASLQLTNEILQKVRLRKVEPRRSELVEIQRNYGLNEPQAAAISASLNCSQGFTLIQGPPGTGKTKTIMGLISAYLSVKHGSAIKVPGQMVAPASKINKNRILCCAPSNAAIDEIARRLKEGISDGRGGRFVPKMVRIGTSDAIHAGVRDITLDAIVDQMLGESREYQKYLEEGGNSEVQSDEMRAEMALLKEEKETLRAQEADENIDAAQAREFGEKISAVSKKLSQLHEKLVQEKQARTQSGAAKDRYRKAVRIEILAKADVILCTLSGAAHDVLGDSGTVSFPTVIVDEACQSVELSTLIPLRHGAKRVVLVGDPSQLPPTVVSQTAQSFKYEQSLFQRMMQNNSDAVHLLSIQYRMHPEISQFPSECFYQGKVQDAPRMAEICKAPWHSDKMFPVYQLYDAHEGREQGGRGHSYFNQDEARLCAQLVETLCARFGGYSFAGKIGVITFYKLQVRKIKDEFIRRWSRDILKYIDINTVDGFQGQEKEVVILSCVRANQDGGVGFIGDVRRMNVALTRSKHTLLLVGNARVLRQNRTWRSLVENAEGRGLIRSPYQLDFAQSGGRAPANLFGTAVEPPNGSDAMRFATQRQENIRNQRSTSAGDGKRDPSRSNAGPRSDSGAASASSYHSRPPNSNESNPRRPDKDGRRPRTDDDDFSKRRRDNDSDLRRDDYRDRKRIRSSDR